VLLTPIGARLLAPGFGSFNHRDATGLATGWIHRAPEQLPGGFGTIGPPCDVWAIGVLFHELIWGWPPLHEPEALEAPPHSLPELTRRLRAADLTNPAAPASALEEVDEALSQRAREITAELLRLTLQFEPARRTRADEIAQWAHLAVRDLQPRRVPHGAATAATPPLSNISSSAPGNSSVLPSPPSLHRSGVPDLGSTRTWIGERRRAFLAEEDDTPAWLLWLLPALALLVIVSLVLGLVLLL
jgi:hypothetical protein